MEIEPAILEAAEIFNDLNGNILQNPRVRITLTDARNYILASPKHYDVIISEPSNPWISEIANLYTREFYEAAKSKLNKDGIFAQWIHNYSILLDDLRMVFRAFGETFSHVSVWGSLKTTASCWWEAVSIRSSMSKPYDRFILAIQR